MTDAEIDDLLVQEMLAYIEHEMAKPPGERRFSADAITGGELRQLIAVLRSTLKGRHYKIAHEAPEVRDA